MQETTEKMVTAYQVTFTRCKNPEFEGGSFVFSSMEEAEDFITGLLETNVMEEGDLLWKKDKVINVPAGGEFRKFGHAVALDMLGDSFRLKSWKK